MRLNATNFEPRKIIAEIQSLPVLPKVMQSLLELRENPDANTGQLADIISSDPIITAHFLKFVNSAFFGSEKKITSLTDAIIRLGFINVLNTAITISAAKAFNIPLDGPIGMREFWRHALYSAHLMRFIASKVPANHKLNPDIVFLSGLLHNIGFVLLGDQFREEFTLINNSIKDNNKKTLLEMEEIFIGAQHTELGVLLMRAWGLPSEIITATFEHHNPNFKGMHWQYANLVYVSNFLLRECALSDNHEQCIPANIVDSLGISDTILQQCNEFLNSQTAQIDAAVECLFKD